MNVYMTDAMIVCDVAMLVNLDLMLESDVK